MSITPPKIDPRTDDEIVAQTEALAQRYTHWKPRSDGQPDAGKALIRIFGRMAALVKNRLNRAPEKNFLAFLDLIGTQIQAPQPARAALTFSLVENSPVDAFVPVGTQVAAPAVEGEDEVVFELESDLVVTRPKLKAVYVREPLGDRYSDHTPAQGETDTSYPIFVAAQPIAHCLYLACDDLLTRPGAKTATLHLSGLGTTVLQQLPITWSYYEAKTQTWTVLKGIVAGLTITIDPILPSIHINPGQAINPGQGNSSPQSFSLSIVQTFSLGNYRSKTVQVLISFDGDNAQLVVQEAARFDHATRICLACLTVSAKGQVSHAPWANLTSTNASTNDTWSVTLPALLPLFPHTIQHRSAAWLEARLDMPLLVLPGTRKPQIDRVQVEIEMNRSGLVPDLCLFNSTPLDISKPFYPFGEQPRFNDTFYLANSIGFSQPGADVKLQVKLIEPVQVKKDGGIELVWEIWNEGRWEELGRSTRALNGEAQSGFRDGTRALTQSGCIEFKVPNAVSTSVVSGESNYWVRARIAKGHYDQSPRFQTVEATLSISLLPADFAPPIVEFLTIDYEFTPATQSATCLTLNDFIYAEPTDRFAPFTSSADRNPAIYLGFDRLLPNRPITLYLQVEALAPGKLSDRTSRLVDSAAIGTERQNQAGQSKIRVEQGLGFQPGQAIRIAPGSSFQEDHEIMAMQSESASAVAELTLKMNLNYSHSPNTRIQRIPAPARLVWEYASVTGGWKSLEAIDETQLLTEPGLVRFIGPTDALLRQEFGQSLYWLRLRWDGGEFLIPPRLRRILTNTTWAAQVLSLMNEVLGSSTGYPNQRFLTSQYPVLENPVLEVREDLSSAEQAALLARDRTILNVLRDDMGSVEEIWVRWQEVPDFYSSEAGDRHYLLNHLTGEIQFGNGQQGRVPPLARQNIRLRQYRTGGGKSGNKSSNTITELKTTLPYISAVVNPEAASGAADPESLAQVQARGPKQLRHRGRAVTMQDLEDLALAASSEVAWVRAIPPVFPEDLEWLPIYQIPAETSGNLEVQLDWTETSTPDLLVCLYGVGQAMPKFQQRISKNQTITFHLTPQTTSTPWRLTITNPHAIEVTSGNGGITYAGGSKIIEFSRLNPVLHSQVVTAGRVDVIIVPRGSENQPTPTLGLINQVEQYLRARCVPTLALHVTEPDWVKVTISATLIPTTWEGADATRDRALHHLARFLHPLTGGPNGLGWTFGRLPHASDIYAVLEGVEGIDFVQPTPELPLIQTDPPTPLSPNFLIYSGTHSLQLS